MRYDLHPLESAAIADLFGPDALPPHLDASDPVCLLNYAGYRLRMHTIVYLHDVHMAGGRVDVDTVNHRMAWQATEKLAA